MFVYIVKGEWWKKLLLLGCTPPLVVGANAVRIAVTGLVALAVRQEAATGAVHDTTGVFVFVFALLGLLFVARTLLGLETLA